MYLNTVFKYNVFKYCPALYVMHTNYLRLINDLERHCDTNSIHNSSHYFIKHIKIISRILQIKATRE